MRFARHRLSAVSLLYASLWCVTSWATDESSPLPGPTPPRPKILWISLEDLSPDLGARPMLADIEAVAKNDDNAGRICKFILKKLKQ